MIYGSFWLAVCQAETSMRSRGARLLRRGSGCDTPDIAQVTEADGAHARDRRSYRVLLPGAAASPL